MVTLEADPRHAAVAKKTSLVRDSRRALSIWVTGRRSRPCRKLRRRSPLFDLIFIDADKANNADYLTWSLKLARPGSVIVGDNVVRNGAILDASSADASVQGTRRLFDLLAREPRPSATAIQTVGDKVWDGFTLAIVD